MRPISALGSRGTGDFPVMPERIDDAPHAPAMLVVNRIDLRGAGIDRLSEGRVGVCNGEDHPNWRGRIIGGGLRRIVGNPEI